MNKLEKLKAIQKAYHTLIPCVKNNVLQDYAFVLNDAPIYLKELIAEEEIKDTLIRNPNRIAFPISSTQTLFIDEGMLCSMSEDERHEFWKSKGARFRNREEEKAFLDAAIKTRETIIQNAAKEKQL